MSGYNGPWYSQRGEDEFIVKHFAHRKPGFFADLGATDGSFMSNTRALYNCGWSGFCVEADPHQCGELVSLYREELRVGIVSAALVPPNHPSPTRFHAGGGGTSTMDDEHARIWAREGDKFKVIYVPTITVGVLMTLFPPPWHFVSIDLEKMTWRVLSGMHLGMIGVELLCVEFDDKRREVIDYCAGFGLKLRRETNENLLLARD